MRIQPRQQLLEIWRATARASFRDGKWIRGGRDSANSISDAEQLLCIMFPATELSSFRLDKPDETADDVLSALGVMGDEIEIPRVLIRVMAEYMERYTGDDGAPIFSGDGYFSSYQPEGPEPILEQRNLDVVDSFSMSITLSLAALGFIRVFRGVISREELRQEVSRLETLASVRLTAAMVGLLRSFSVNVFDAHSAAGRVLRSRSNQAGLPDRMVIQDLQYALRDVKSGLRDLTIGSGQAADIDSSSRLFECGWSWGIIKNAEHIETSEKVVQPAGVAEDSPFLYFTVVALDGIADLFSARTRILGLLNEEQRRLAQALQLRWDLTQQYWSTIATFGTDRWPLEDIPWRTSDEEESDYFSLLVCSMVVQDLVNRRASDTELGRVGRVLDELANRGRINRRPLRGDPAIGLHAPGVRLRLRGSENAGDQMMGWLVSNFAPLLLKRTMAIAGLVRDTELRGSLLMLADSVWDHLNARRLGEGSGQNLWDQPADAFPALSARHEFPSWYFTERVVECLVVTANVVDRAPLHSGRLADVAEELLHEANHLFDRELLSGSGEAGPAMRAVVQTIRANLRRARHILRDRPGSAAVLAIDVLRDLDRLAAARQDVVGGN